MRGRPRQSELPRGPAPEPAPPDGHELARAARVLAIRSRRQATGPFSGGYASAFRGGGMEFDESRPYAPGDDARNIDWNARARSGELYVKHFREERDRTLVLALDVSSSMQPGAPGPSKARVAAHTAALLAMAAARTGDRVGLVAFDEEVRLRLSPARGTPHTGRIIRAAIECAERASGGTRLGAGLEAIHRDATRGSIGVLLSDFRAEEAEASSSGDGRGGEQASPVSFEAVAKRHDLVSIVLYDPHEERLPDVGWLRVRDPEHPGTTQLLDSSSRKVRARYAEAWRARRQALEGRLRAAGSDLLWLRSDHDPLHALMHFFQRRAARSWRSGR